MKNKKIILGLTILSLTTPLSNIFAMNKKSKKFNMSKKITMNNNKKSQNNNINIHENNNNKSQNNQDNINIFNNEANNPKTKYKPKVNYFGLGYQKCCELANGQDDNIKEKVKYLENIVKSNFEFNTFCDILGKAKTSCSLMSYAIENIRKMVDLQDTNKNDLKDLENLEDLKYFITLLFGNYMRICKLLDNVLSKYIKNNNEDEDIKYLFTAFDLTIKDASKLETIKENIAEKYKEYKKSEKYKDYIENYKQRFEILKENRKKNNNENNNNNNIKNNNIKNNNNNINIFNNNNNKSNNKNNTNEKDNEYKPKANFGLSYQSYCVSANDLDDVIEGKINYLEKIVNNNFDLDTFDTYVFYKICNEAIASCSSMLGNIENMQEIVNADGNNENVLKGLKYFIHFLFKNYTRICKLLDEVLSQYIINNKYEDILQYLFTAFDLTIKDASKLETIEETIEENIAEKYEEYEISKKEYKDDIKNYKQRLKILKENRKKINNPKTEYKPKKYFGVDYQNYCKLFNSSNDNIKNKLNNLENIVHSSSFDFHNFYKECNSIIGLCEYMLNYIKGMWEIVNKTDNTNENDLKDLENFTNSLINNYTRFYELLNEVLKRNINNNNNKQNIEFFNNTLNLITRAMNELETIVKNNNNNIKNNNIKNNKALSRITRKVDLNKPPETIKNKLETINTYINQIAEILKKITDNNQNINELKLLYLPAITARYQNLKKYICNFNEEIQKKEILNKFVTDYYKELANNANTQDNTSYYNSITCQVGCTYGNMQFKNQTLIDFIRSKEHLAKQNKDIEKKFNSLKQIMKEVEDILRNIQNEFAKIDVNNSNNTCNNKEENELTDNSYIDKADKILQGYNNNQNSLKKIDISKIDDIETNLKLIKKKENEVINKEAIHYINNNLIDDMFDCIKKLKMIHSYFIYTRQTTEQAIVDQIKEQYKQKDHLDYSNCFIPFNDLISLIEEQEKIECKKNEKYFNIEKVYQDILNIKGTLINSHKHFCNKINYNYLDKYLFETIYGNLENNINLNTVILCEIYIDKTTKNKDKLNDQKIQKIEQIILKITEKATEKFKPQEEKLNNTEKATEKFKPQEEKLNNEEKYLYYKLIKDINYYDKLIKGTNDSKSLNRIYLNEIKNLIQKFDELCKNPQVNTLLEINKMKTNLEKATSEYNTAENNIVEKVKEIEEEDIKYLNQEFIKIITMDKKIRNDEKNLKNNYLNDKLKEINTSLNSLESLADRYKKSKLKFLIKDFLIEFLESIKRYIQAKINNSKENAKENANEENAKENANKYTSKYIHLKPNFNESQLKQILPDKYSNKYAEIINYYYKKSFNILFKIPENTNNSIHQENDNKPMRNNKYVSNRNKDRDKEYIMKKRANRKDNVGKKDNIKSSKEANSIYQYPDENIDKNKTQIYESNKNDLLLKSIDNKINKINSKTLQKKSINKYQKSQHKYIDKNIQKNNTLIPTKSNKISKIITNRNIPTREEILNKLNEKLDNMIEDLIRYMNSMERNRNEKNKEDLLALKERLGKGLNDVDEKLEKMGEIKKNAQFKILIMEKLNNTQKMVNHIEKMVRINDIYNEINQFKDNVNKDNVNTKPETAIYEKLKDPLNELKEEIQQTIHNLTNQNETIICEDTKIRKKFKIINNNYKTALQKMGKTLTNKITSAKNAIHMQETYNKKHNKETKSKEKELPNNLKSKKGRYYFEKACRLIYQISKIFYTPQEDGDNSEVGAHAYKLLDEFEKEMPKYYNDDVFIAITIYINEILRIYTAIKTINFDYQKAIKIKTGIVKPTKDMTQDFINEEYQRTIEQADKEYDRIMRICLQRINNMTKHKFIKKISQTFEDIEKLNKMMVNACHNLMVMKKRHDKSKKIFF